MNRTPSVWTPEMVRSIRATPSTTAPPVDWPGRKKTLPGYHVWDTWPVQLANGQIARFDDRTYWIMLAAPDNVVPEERHNIAYHHVACLDSESRWHDCGPLFPEDEARGSRQWAGSALFDPTTNAITFFYTAAGRAEDEGISYEQRIVHTRARIEMSNHGITFTDWSEHQVILEAEGQHYKPTQGTRGGPGAIDAFRDPGYFHDPPTGSNYLLFTASLQECDTPDHDGAIGLARCEDSNLEHWTLLPPILTAAGVNKELERPHIIMRDGRYYLFFSTHGSTFAPELEAPEGLYGFVAERVEGPYQPLNESGLVIQNPDVAPYQAYSWLVLSDGQIISFLYYGDLGGENAETLSGERQFDHFGGVQAPVLAIEIQGNQTWLLD